jgi:hypothetical protein
MGCEETLVRTEASYDTPETNSSTQPIDWRCAHEALSRLALTRAALDWQEGRCLLSALRTGAHIHLGFGSFAEYVERLLGYKPRWTQERLRVAEALENLPELTQGLRDGLLGWSAIRELTRVATSDNESEWIAATRDRTLRQIEQLVSGHRPGDTPDDPPDDAARRHVLRFEVGGEVLATFRATPWQNFDATPTVRWTMMARCS